ncbi:MAG: SIS domain-containing protein [Candidatus Taylorbacteria bacterium]|nr:SIS domain-containing protein [Candidatus Taylorbacteria bacterium]
MKKQQNYINTYLTLVKKVVAGLDTAEIEAVISLLVKLKKAGGRLFLLGVGGSAANCSHAVNDFRKICRIEAYAPTDNVAELTARTNDDGWGTVFCNWLEVSKLTSSDMVMVLSVGGGLMEKNVSPNIVKALEFAQKVGSVITGIVSRDGGYTRKVATASILIPIGEADFITPLAESFQAVIWHLLVTHPKLAKH